MSKSVTYYSKYASQTYLEAGQIMAEFHDHRFTTDNPEIIEFLDKQPDIGSTLWQEKDVPAGEVQDSSTTPVTEDVETAGDPKKQARR